MKIGDVFLALLADAKGFAPSVEKEAAKAGDAGAKTLGARLGGALKTEGVKVFGRAASAAFAVAAAGAARLEEIQARIRTETGAGAKEAEAAAKAINAAAGAEQMSLEAVSEIAFRVRRDLGATGKEADNLTARFAKFARVTRQDGATAVEDFDDIVDRWNLDASKSAEIQDVLIAGWQKFGGTIEGNQKALAALAPQLRALNLDWKDGAALINLFNASGLEGTEQVRALNTAIKKLKPGQTFNDLIAQIAAIEDPVLRAQKAMEIFGARGGSSMTLLAEKIKPGVEGLDDFGISAEDAGDKVEEMGDILDSTLTGRVKKWFSEAAAGVREFGFDLGSAVTALSSLGFLISSIGGGKLLKGLGRALLMPFLGLGRRIAMTIATQLAASTVVNTIGDGLAGAINKVPGVASLKTGLGKVGTFLGSTAGKAFGLAFAAAAVFLAVDTFNRIKGELDAQMATITGNVAGLVKTGTDAQLNTALDALRTAMKGLEQSALSGNVFAVDQLKATVAAYNEVQTELNHRAALAAAVTETSLRAARPGVASATRDLVGEIPTGLQKSAARIAGAARAFLAKPIGEQLQLIGPAGIRAGAELALGIASGLRSSREGITSALSQLRDDMTNRISPKKEVALRIGQLFSKTLSKGLKDADPVVKAQAEGTRGLIEAQLIETVKAGGKAGEDIMDKLERKLSSKDPKVKAQAERTKSLIDVALKAQPPKTPGEAIGDQLNRDLSDQGTTLGKTAYSLGETIARNLLRGVKGVGPSLPGGDRTPTRRFEGSAKITPFASGTSYVPRDMLAYLHRGEAVLTKAENAAVHSTINQGGITVNIGRVDHRSMADVRREMQIISDKRGKGW